MSHTEQTCTRCGGDGGSTVYVRVINHTWFGDMQQVKIQPLCDTCETKLKLVMVATVEAFLAEDGSTCGKMDLTEHYEPGKPCPCCGGD